MNRFKQCLPAAGVHIWQEGRDRCACRCTISQERLKLVRQQERNFWQGIDPGSPDGDLAVVTAWALKNSLSMRDRLRREAWAETLKRHDPDLVATIKHGDPPNGLESRTSTDEPMTLGEYADSIGEGHLVHSEDRDLPMVDSDEDDVTPEEKTRLQAIVNETDSGPSGMMAKVEQEAMTMGMARARKFLMLDRISGKDSGWPVTAMCGVCIGRLVAGSDDVYNPFPPIHDVGDILIGVIPEECPYREDHEDA